MSEKTPTEISNYDYVHIGGYSSDTKFTLSRNTYNQAFIWITVMFIIAFVLIVSLIIWRSVEATNLKTPPPPRREFQYTMNPIILTEEQCRGIPNATWSEVGCTCQDTYSGAYCKELLVTRVGEALFTPITGKMNVEATVTKNNFDNLNDCRYSCLNDDKCSGFVFDNANGCQLLQNTIRVTKRQKKKSSSQVFLRQPSLVQFDDVVFVGPEDTIPHNYWEVLSEIPLGKVVQLSFIPTTVITPSTSKGQRIVGIYSPNKLHAKHIKHYLRGMENVLVVNDNQIPSTTATPVYVLYVRISS